MPISAQISQRRRAPRDDLLSEMLGATHGGAAISDAVDELLRYDSPAQLHGRYTPHDLKVDDKVIPAGSRIILLIGAANRDPERYTDPDQLDLRRPEPRPLSFGTGVHACLGAWVARLEGEVALPMLLDRFPTIGRIAGPLQWWSEPAAIRALQALPVELSTR